MKCPNCGKLNRIGSTNCFYCGTALADSSPSWLEEVNKKSNNTVYARPDQYGNISEASDSREALAQEMAYLRESSVEGRKVQEKYKEIARRRGSRSKNPLVEEVMEEALERGDTDSLERVRRQFASMDGDYRNIADAYDMQRQRYENRPLADTADFDMGYGEVYGAAQNQSLKSKRHRRRLRIFFIIPILLVLAGIGYGAVSILKMDRISSGEEAVKTQARIIPSLLNDAAAHTIQIPGEEGQQIYIKELHKNFIVTNGYATVEVADYTWYESYEEYVKETLDVTLSPYIRKTNGKLIPLEPVNYTIEIPLSPLQIVTPATGRDTVYTSIYRIEIKVRQNSKLWINGEDFSDIVNTDDGNVSFNANVRPIGENVFEIVCKSQYSRANTKTIVINRPKQEIPVDLASDISSVSTFPYMTVKASTVPGAYILVQTPHTDLDITNVDTDGTFSFKAMFETIGDNEIVFTASKPGLKTTEIKHTVYYVPDIDKYSRAAWAMDEANYTQLVNTITDRVKASQKYVCIGKIEEIITESPQLAVMNCGTEERPLRILLENRSNVAWEIGKSYRVYADAYGLYRDMPRLSGRYTYIQ